MENKKDIGRAFREKLDGLQKPAPGGGWDSISSQLGQINKPSKFPWLKATIVSLAVIIGIALLTHSFWDKHTESPVKDANQTVTGTPENGQPENAATEIQASPAHGSNASGIIQGNSPMPGNPNRNTIAPIIQQTEDKQYPATSYEPVADSKSHMAATTENTASVLPVTQNSSGSTDTNTGKITENTDKIPDNRRGKLKDPTDYGADSLVIKKRPEKRDFSKVADSLNKLYGKIEKIRLSFNIPANLGIQSGNRTFYIQVVDPNNKVVNEKIVAFSGGHTLAYSLTADVVYENKALAINEALKGRNFAKGLYRINVFDKEKLLTSSTFTFK